MTKWVIVMLIVQYEVYLLECIGIHLIIGNNYQFASFIIGNHELVK